VNGLFEEVAFVSLSSSAAVWEVLVKNKWKVLSMEIAAWLEEQRRKGQTQVILEDIIEVCMKTLNFQKLNVVEFQ